MRGCLAIALFLLGSCAAQAATIELRTGDHPDFSRLVLTQIAPDAWRLGRSGDGYIFASGNAADKFDLAEAFVKMGHQRILSLADLGHGQLSIQPAPNVHAQAFVLSTGEIVVDLIKGTPPDQSRFELPFEDKAPADEIVEIPVDLPLPIKEVLPPIEVNLPVLLDERSDNVKPFDVVGVDLASERVEATRSEVLNAIARAAAQGLVQADTSPTDEVVEALQPDPQNEPTEVGRILEPDLSAHMRVSTSEAATTSNSVENLTPAGNMCVDGDLLDLSVWGTDNTSVSSISVLLGQAVGEFDLPVSDKVDALQKAYIYLGFGAEAVATANAFGLQLTVESALIASILDNRQLPETKWIEDQATCDTPAAMWAILASQRSFGSLKPNITAAIRSFVRLPPHLQAIFGPMLLDRFNAAGELDAAALIDNALGHPSSETELERARAEMAIADGDLDEGTDKLREIAQSNDPVAPDAVAALLSAQLAAGLPVDPADIDAAESLGFELRGTEQGTKLTLLAIRSMVATADFRRARATLIRVEGWNKSTPQNIPAEWTNFYAVLTQSGSLADFLLYTIGSERFYADARENRSQLTETAKRLLSYGLDQNAREVLDLDAGVPDRPQRLIYAEIAIAQSKGRIALGYLAGLEGRDVDVLRAKGLELDGDSEAAIKLYGQLGMTNHALRAAWASGNWELLPRQSGAAQSDFADRVATKSGTSGVTLAAGQSTILESQALRTILKELFDLSHAG